MSELLRMPAGLPETPCVVRAWIFSHGLSARYFGCPVYLVGGALADPQPRDVDVVVPLPDDLFWAMYNDGRPATDAWDDGHRMSTPPPGWRLWARDCAKHSRQMTLYCLRSVDFKTQTQTFFDAQTGPRLRLSCEL